MPTARCYVRVSTDRQENSLEAQQARLIEAGKALGMPVSMYVDEDVSARSTPLHMRPEGKRLCEDLQPGDHVFFTSISRGFRRAAECIGRFQTWWDLGITAHLLDMNVDMSTPYGRAILGYMAVGAELESDLHSARKKEIYAHKAKSGKPYALTRPYGWVVTRDSKGRLKGWAKCEAERETGRLVIAMREQGFSWADICFNFCVKRKIVKPKSGGGGKYYHSSELAWLRRAAVAGYPRLPQAFWQSRDYAEKLAELRSNGDPRLSEEYIPL